MPTIKYFKGLNNVSDPLRLGLSWLTTADNINVTDTGAIEQRNGYTLSQAGAYRSAYNTSDYARSYFVKGTQLVDFSGNVLTTLTGSAPMHWAEINDQVYYNNGADSGIIQPDNTVTDWRWPVPTAPTVSLATGTLAPGVYSVCCTYVLADGRETGPSDPVTITLVEGQAISISGIPHTAGAFTRVYIAPANSSVFQLAATTLSAFTWNASNDALGIDLCTDGLDPLPFDVSYIQVFKGRVYAAQYFATLGQSAVWFSQPLGFHLFRLNTDFFMVQGEVTMLAPTDSALIVGTDDKVLAYDGETITELADYGVVQGKAWDVDGKRILIWTARGVCSALPFENLTEQQVSVPPGVRAASCVIHSSGQKRFVSVLQQGGESFNARP